MIMFLDSRNMFLDVLTFKSIVYHLKLLGTKYYGIEEIQNSFIFIIYIICICIYYKYV